ncbi:quinolinate synthase NadA [uncultured Catenibacterium sp.]|mgnify:FL=1|uniref:quinolinate synthase NadA n=1 Tax=uncultured Catenibacterium sp. TaxID=286142 RepID=UPI00258E81EE|nr:quinolinate synthase NadA [uncultured Catenibacterium sp.]
MDMMNRIKQLKEEKNAVILAHYYVNADVQEVADFIGDSFYLAKKASETDADKIVFAGVEFMGESAKILNPNKHVYMPDAHADCPMAHMVTIENIKKMREKYDDLAVVCYINSTAEIKTYSDVCVTSSNAVKIVNKLPNKNIFFIPDQNLGSYVATQVKNKNIILNSGFCPRHHIMTKEDVLNAKKEHPNALVAVHPECKPEVLEEANYIGSTSGIIDYIVGNNAKEFIVGTVDGVYATILKQAPDKKLYNVVKTQVCPNMKLNSLEKIIHVLETGENEVFLDEEFMNKAKAPLERMLELAK